MAFLVPFLELVENFKLLTLYCLPSRYSGFGVENYQPETVVNFYDVIFRENYCSSKGGAIATMYGNAHVFNS